VGRFAAAVAAVGTVVTQISSKRKSAGDSQSPPPTPKARKKSNSGPVRSVDREEQAFGTGFSGHKGKTATFTHASLNHSLLMCLVFYLLTQTVKSQRVTAAESDSDWTDDECDDNDLRDRGGPVANAHAAGTSEESFLMGVLRGN
jgi:hypothetical protein